MHVIQSQLVNYSYENHTQKNIKLVRWWVLGNDTESLAGDEIILPFTKEQEDIFIKSEGKFTRINYHDILYIESIGDYVKYFTLLKNYVSHGTLKAVEEKLNHGHFMKVHRSYIVNLRKIKDIQDYSLVIEGKVIPISKVLKSEVLQRINIV